jgi:hypothetical protein
MLGEEVDDLSTHVVESPLPDTTAFESYDSNRFANRTESVAHSGGSMRVEATIPLRARTLAAGLALNMHSAPAFLM